MKYIIVGIDAGTTTAIAALDLNGNLVEIRSSKELELEQMIDKHRKRKLKVQL